MTIPLAAALALLDKAHDVIVVDQPTTVLFVFDAAAEGFMQLTTNDGDDSFDYVFDYVFEKDLNAEVLVEGDEMILIASPDTEAGNDEPIRVTLRLMAPLQLTPPTREAAEVHAKQCELESHLNYILMHVRDAEEVGKGSFDERRDEVKRHARTAKEAFDWLDNETVWNAVETPPDAKLLKSLNRKPPCPNPES